MKKIFTLLIVGWGVFLVRPVKAEWLSVEGNPAKWGDIIEVSLRDLHPTQTLLGFDRVYYKLGRYAKDPRKIFDEYCETNGQKGIRDFSYNPETSDLQKPGSFACLEPVGMDQSEMKTVVIAPDNNLYLTDGHHTFNAFWHMRGGGPDLRVDVIVARDYRNFKTMDEFWKQMEAEKNMWLIDANDQKITVADLPRSLGLNHFKDDSYRSLLYFTKRIAWASPSIMSAPDAKFYGDNMPSVPFLEFYWIREIRSQVSLAKFDLTTRNGYVAAIKAVGEAIINSRSSNVGGSGKSVEEMGQFRQFNGRELFRIDRPATGKLAYMLAYKSAVLAKQSEQNRSKVVLQLEKTSNQN